MKSIAQTNSGKLVTIVSSDIHSIERQMCCIPIVIAAPFINIVVYIIIGLTSSWEFSLIVFLLWMVVMTFQFLVSERQKKLKKKEALHGDERMKLVSDMVVGARTIKSYGWENHFLNKIKKERDEQVGYIYK
jgi:ABC-type multidrug transport system fused ATPase/permease subunit